MCEAKRIVYLVGAGMGTPGGMTQEAKEALEGCGCILGAKRLTAPFEEGSAPCHALYEPEKIRAYLDGHPEVIKAGIVLSGDTGFYSGAKKLEEALSDGYEIRRIPGISSVVYLAAALHVSWEDAALVSLHGRRQNWIYEVVHNARTFLLLGGNRAGERIGEKLRHYGLGDVTVFVGKNFSYPDEKIFSRKGSELSEEETEGLCVLGIENPGWERHTAIHVPDGAFLRGSVPMTKEEVRTVCIAKLRLTKDAVLYDVGAGTGSVSVEAALQGGGIRVYAVEKNPEGVDLIRRNAQKFRTDAVQAVEGNAPEALEQLEAPTHVFIGGSSGNLKEIIRTVRAKNEKARIVLTAISLDTMAEVMDAVKTGLLREPEIVQMSVAKSRKLGAHHMMTGQNPIYIVSEAEG